LLRCRNCEPNSYAPIRRPAELFVLTLFARKDITCFVPLLSTGLFLKAKVLLFSVLAVGAIAGLACIVGGIQTLNSGPGHTVFQAFGAKIDTTSIGVALIGIGAILILGSGSSVLSYAVKLAALPPDGISRSSAKDKR
jgi:hypothetical protein